MNPLLSFLPIDRCHAIASGSHLPEQINGVAIFADISGFTPLAQSLTEELRRRRGSEELLRIINPVYDAIIGVLHQYRGAVIGFAGDSILCWLNKEDGNVHGRALTCAFAMQQAMVPFQTVYTPNGTAVSLSIKISLTSGAARRLLVGDPDIMVLEALAGQTIARISQGEELAQAGEIVASKEIITAVESSLEIAEWRGSFAILNGFADIANEMAWPPLDHTDLTTEQLRPWVPRTVYQRLQTGGALLGDLRLVSPLFLKFEGIDYDTDKAAEKKLDTFVRWAQKTVARYKGTVLQLDIGDKGSYLYINFGAFQAHEDDAHRAILAALTLSELPEQLSFITKIQIGLTRGIVWTGTCGAKNRHTFGVMGNPVNLAARLMGQAGTETILCDYATYQATKNTIEYKLLPPIRVKGRVDLLRVYRPIRAKQLGVDSPSTKSMVGRENELSKLAKSLDQIEIQNPQLILIEGDAGIGKSTLIEQFTHAWRGRGHVGLIGAAQSIEQQTPYLVWSDIFISFFGLEHLTSSAEKRKQVTATFHQILPQQTGWLPLMNDILNLGLPETVHTSSLSADIRQQKLQELLISLLQRWLEDSELILVLEDAHWLDSLSWELTEQIVKTIMAGSLSLALVIVSRPIGVTDFGHSNWQWLQRQTEQLTLLSLETLPDGAINHLIANTLKADSETIPAAVVEFINGRANGNPFFTEELTATLKERDFIDVENGRCLIKASLQEAQQTIPDSLHNLILSRLDQLSAEQQMILKIASVLGRRFGLAPLQAILPEYLAIDATGLQANLQALEMANFTYLETLEPRVAYIFKHIITQEATYQTLLYQQRRQLHESAIRWYETQLLDADRDAVLPRLVHHSHHAENISKEQHYAQLAGEQAAARFANQDAVTYFTRALQLLSPKQVEQSFALYLHRENVHGLLGQREAQLADLSMIDSLADTLDHTKQITAALRYTRYFEAITDYSNAIDYAQKSVRLAQEIKNTALEAETQLRLGEITWRLSHYEEACLLLETAVFLAIRANRPKIEADAIRLIGVTYMYRRDIQQALDYFYQAYDLYIRLNDKIGQASALNNLGFAARNQGNYDQSIQHLQHGLKLYQQVGYPRRQALIFHNLAEGYGQLGAYATAADYCHQSLAIKRTIEDIRGQIMTLCVLSNMTFRMGQLDTAYNRIHQAEALAEKSANKVLLIQTQLFRGLISVLADQADIGMQILKVQSEQAEAVGMVSFKQEIDLIMARVSLKQDDLQTAVNLITPILPRFEDDEKVSTFFFPMLAYLTVIEILHATEHGRGDPLLKRAHTILQHRAGLIQDKTLQRSFLNNVNEHRQLIEMYQNREIE